MAVAPENDEWPRASWAAGYFVLYYAYLWFYREGELLHWLSLVLLPALGLLLLGRRREPNLGPRQIGARLGLRWPERRQGMKLALGLILAVQIPQIMNRAQLAEVVSVLSNASAVWIVPVSFVLMLITVAFTEEFFFRGILQRSLSARYRSNALGIAVTSVAFSLYHIPYAYFIPQWPSAGNMVHAIQLGFVNGMLGGVVLGAVFVRSKSSLIPCILVHAGVDWVPAIKLLGHMVGDP